MAVSHVRDLVRIPYGTILWDVARVLHPVEGNGDSAEVATRCPFPMDGQIGRVGGDATTPAGTPSNTSGQSNAATISHVSTSRGPDRFT